jgi:hypothetical protein
LPFPKDLSRVSFVVPAVYESLNDARSALAGQLNTEERHRRLAKRLAGRDLSPGALHACKAKPWHSRNPRREDVFRVQDGHHLTCSCQAPATGRDDGCHLEEVAWWLVRAGWDVVLWADRITQQDGQAIFAATGAPFLGRVPPETRQFLIEDHAARQPDPRHSKGIGRSRYAGRQPSFRQATNFGEDS